MRKYRQEKRKRNMCFMVGYEYWNSIPGCSMKKYQSETTSFSTLVKVLSLYCLYYLLYHEQGKT